MEHAEMEQAVIEHSSRLKALETILPFLATKEQFGQLIAEMKTMRYSVLATLAVFAVDIVARWMGH